MMIPMSLVLARHQMIFSEGWLKLLSRLVKFILKYLNFQSRVRDAHLGQPCKSGLAMGLGLAEARAIRDKRQMKNLLFIVALLG